MNFALIIDGCVQKSYYVKDKRSYRFGTDEPYSHHHSIGNECHIGLWGWPFVFDGCFLNWTEFSELPTLDLDVIMVAIEKNFNYNVGALRKKYPNATIISFVKEDYWVNGTIQQRVDFFKSCDVITFPWKIERDDDPNGILGIQNMIERCGRDVHYVPQPHDIDFLYDRYFEPDRDIQILNYKAPTDGRDGGGENYVDYIGNKYNVKVIKHSVKYEGPEHKQWEEFLSGITKSLYCFNTAKIKTGGSMAVQCAALGILNFGGIQDSHEVLFPETATNDLDELELIFKKIHNDTDLRNSMIKRAFDKAVENYSHASVKEKVLNIIN